MKVLIKCIFIFFLSHGSSQAMDLQESEQSDLELVDESSSDEKAPKTKKKNTRYIGKY